MAIVIVGAGALVDETAAQAPSATGSTDRSTGLVVELVGRGLWSLRDRRAADSWVDVVIADRADRRAATPGLVDRLSHGVSLTEALSLGWGGGKRWTFDSDRPGAVAALMIDPSGPGKDFFTLNNFQPEVSLRWLAGPVTIAVGVNFTRAIVGNGSVMSGPEKRGEEGPRMEFAAWLRF